MGAVRASSASAAVAVLAAALLSGEIVDRIAATVNDTAIPESEVRKAMLVSALSPDPEESPEAFRTRILEALIDQHLEYEDAARFGPAPPDAAQIAEAMKKLLDRLKAEGRDPRAEFARAGMTEEDVEATLERQLVIQRYLKERFAPIAYADEEQAQAEYRERYVPEREAAKLPVEPFDKVMEEMRRRASERAFDEQVARWLKELRQKARIGIYRIPPSLDSVGTPVVVATAPAAASPSPPPPPSVRTPAP
jgi:hypothetical protein